MKNLIPFQRLSSNDFLKMQSEEFKTERNKNKIMSKLSATQNALKKKFDEAYTNRLEHENNLNESLNKITTPLPTIESETHSSLRRLSESKNKTQQLRLATKSYSNHTKKTRPEALGSSNLKNVNNIPNSIDDPNELCDKLRLVLSSLNAGDAKNVEEINAIIMRLRKSEVVL